MKRLLKNRSIPTKAQNEPRKNEKSEYLNTAQAAHYLGVCKSFLEQRRQKTRPDLMRQSPPFVRIGRHVRYKISDLDAWLEARRFNPEGLSDG